MRNASQQTENATAYDRRDLTGPFDIVGDVHGCYTELVELLTELGYVIRGEGDLLTVTPPEGRTLIFVGDLVDRGPDTPSVLRLAMAMTAAGTAFVVTGNHDDKLMRALMGRNVQITHGLEISLAQLKADTPAFRARVLAFLQNLVTYYVFDGGRLVVAHAGLRERMIGRPPEAVRHFTLYGATTGKLDANGLPVRLNWMKDYHGDALVVYGHTPVAEPVRINNTLNIDTGCVFGGALTVLRYPEMTFVSVQAHEIYREANRPLLHLEDF
jgi:protein phosphatase